MTGLGLLSGRQSAGPECRMLITRGGGERLVAITSICSGAALRAQGHAQGSRLEAHAWGLLLCQHINMPGLNGPGEASVPQALGL